MDLKIFQVQGAGGEEFSIVIELENAPMANAAPGPSPRLPSMPVNYYTGNQTHLFGLHRDQILFEQDVRLRLNALQRC
jgi:hypothetical protein